MGKLLDLPKNIALASINIEGANNLAYYALPLL
jgi:hypothetical protein